MEKKKSSTLLNTVVLVVISVVAVALLAIVNQITLEPIAQADVNQKAEIYKVVYPGCDSFTEFDNAEEMITAVQELLSGKDPYREKRSEIHRLFNYHHDGNSAKRICQQILAK